MLYNQTDPGKDRKEKKKNRKKARESLDAVLSSYPHTFLECKKRGAIYVQLIGDTSLFFPTVSQPENQVPLSPKTSTTVIEPKSQPQHQVPLPTTSPSLITTTEPRPTSGQPQNQVPVPTTPNSSTTTTTGSQSRNQVPAPTTSNSSTTTTTGSQSRNQVPAPTTSNSSTTTTEPKFQPQNQVPVTTTSNSSTSTTTAEPQPTTGFHQNQAPLETTTKTSTTTTEPKLTTRSLLQSRSLQVETTEALSSIPTYFNRVKRSDSDSSSDEMDDVLFKQAAGNLDESLDSFFFLKSEKDASSVKRGYSLASRSGSSEFSESAYLGRMIKIETEDIPGKVEEVYLNTHEPFCIATVGVQGSGKSHTLSVILESCLVPFPRPKGHEIIRLRSPMTALVLHYDQNVTSVCEATGLICPTPSLQRMMSERIALPREKMVVLVSPTYYLQRKKFYGDYCIVKPLLFKWATLTADHIKKLMCINEGDNQLYVASMLNLLRGYQRNGVVPEFQGFLKQIQTVCNIKSQESPLLQRVALLESFVAESHTNSSLQQFGTDLFSSLGPGVLVVADLTDPLLSSLEANGIFQVLTEQFRSIPLSDGCGKLLALDEAHKFMSGVASDGLSNSIINAARLMRHDGMRVVVSTQSPKALAPELLELVTVAILHRFHSRDWFTYLQTKVPLEEECFKELIQLAPGQAVVFASRHLVDVQDLTLRVAIRNRITADRGSSRTNRI